MDTSLQQSHIAVEDLSQTTAEVEEAEHHIHLPNPSFWPLVVSGAILITVIGLLFIPDAPWMTIIGAVLILAAIIAWALEDPLAPLDTVQGQAYEYHPELTPDEVHEMAQLALDRAVTVSSTAYSVHPVKVEVDQVKENGVVLALFGKVELAAQREQIEEAVRQIPNVLSVRNFLIAEDEIEPRATARIEELRANGKLEGAVGLQVQVENYILHLYGEVPNGRMRQMLEKEMLGIPGVRVVVNHIGLNKDIPGNLGKTLNKI